MTDQLPRISALDTSATIDPVGGRVASFRVGEREVLFAPVPPLEDPRAWVPPGRRWVQAGIPVLFPQAGTLAGDRFADADTTIPAHGLVYSRPWTVDLHWASRIALSIASDQEMERAYPYSWRLTQEVVVGPRTLRLTLRLTNGGATPLPAAPGWHPYFAVPLPEKSLVRLDDVAGFRPPSSASAEIDDVLKLPRHPLTLRYPSGQVRLTTSDHCRCVVAWTMPDQPFLCVEPWVGPPNALNQPAQRLTVAPGATVSLWMEVSLPEAG